MGPAMKCVETWYASLLMRNADLRSVYQDMFSDQHVFSDTNLCLTAPVPRHGMRYMVCEHNMFYTCVNLIF